MPHRNPKLRGQEGPRRYWPILLSIVAVAVLGGFAVLLNRQSDTPPTREVPRPGRAVEAVEQADPRPAGERRMAPRPQQGPERMDPGTPPLIPGPDNHSSQ